MAWFLFDNGLRHDRAKWKWKTKKPTEISPKNLKSRETSNVQDAFSRAANLDFLHLQLFSKR